MIKIRLLKIIQQAQPHAVAIISLITALSGVFYDTWRDHRNEMNENARNAAFEVLKSLGELQTIVNYAHYDGDRDKGHPIEGWKHVLLIRDLSYLLPKQNQQKSEALYQTWQEDWESLMVSDASEQRISQQVASARLCILNTLEHLQ